MHGNRRRTDDRGTDSERGQARGRARERTRHTCPRGAQPAAHQGYRSLSDGRDAVDRVSREFDETGGRRRGLRQQGYCTCGAKGPERRGPPVQGRLRGGSSRRDPHNAPAARAPEADSAGAEARSIHSVHADRAVSAREGGGNFGGSRLDGRREHGDRGHQPQRGLGVPEGGCAVSEPARRTSECSREHSQARGIG